MLTRSTRSTRRRQRLHRARGHRLALALAIAAVGFGSAVAAPAVLDTVLTAGGGHLPIGSLPEDDTANGMIYSGLSPAKRGAPCVGAFEVTAREQCSHGPDLPPPGLNVKKDILPASGAAGSSGVPERDPTAGPTESDLAKDENGFSTNTGLAVLPEGVAAGAPVVVGPAGVVCEGDGVAGPRVQVLYVRDAGTASRFAKYAESFRTWAAGVDAIFEASAQETGGSRHVRFVTTPDCRVDVQEVEIPPGAMATFNSMISALGNLGFNRTDRKYMIFGDAQVYCGIATFTADDRKSPDNLGNSGPSYGRADAGCWTPSVAAHELAHNFGAVNNSAPNSSQAGHCLDEYDLLCYPDAVGQRATFACAEESREHRLDCNHDDYFNTSPSPGSYLATHWNVADSAFLIAGPNVDGSPPGGTGPSRTTPGASQPAGVPAAGGAGPAPSPKTTSVAPPPSPAAPAKPLVSSAGKASGSPSGSASPAATGSTLSRDQPPAHQQSGATGPKMASQDASPSPAAQLAVTAPTPDIPGQATTAELKQPKVTDTATSSTRLAWDPAGPDRRYTVAVNGRTLGQVRTAAVRIVGMRADTEYELAVTLVQPDGSGTPYTAPVKVRTAAAAAPSGNAYLVFTNAFSQRVADLYGARSAEGTPLVLDRARGATNQHWRLEPGAGGTFLIRSRSSGRCLAPKDGVDSAGTPLVQVTCDQADAAQRWRTAVTPYGFSLSSTAGLVVGVGNSRFGGGRLVVLQRSTGAKYQSWSAREA